MRHNKIDEASKDYLKSAEEAKLKELAVEETIELNKILINETSNNNNKTSSLRTTPNNRISITNTAQTPRNNLAGGGVSQQATTPTQGQRQMINGGTPLVRSGNNSTTTQPQMRINLTVPTPPSQPTTPTTVSNNVGPQNTQTQRMNSRKSIA
jgi:hypothetical protein